MKKRYLPIMKFKAAELGAIRMLRPSAWDQLNPLFELTEDSIDSENEAEIQEEVAKIVNFISKSCPPGKLVFLDFDLVGECGESPSNVFLGILEAVRKKNIIIAPVISHYSTEHAREAVRCYSAVSHQREIAYRVYFEQLGPDFREQVLDDLQQLNILPERVHLIVDCEFITSAQTGAYQTVLRHNLEHLAALQCASVTLAGTSYPSILNIDGGTVGEIFRAEWHLWNAVCVMNIPGIERLDFGDYTVTHPELVAFDVTKMTIAAKIVYTTENAWKIYKGKSVKKYTWEQVHALAQSLVASTEFRGEAFSAAEEHIVKCANRQTTSGNPATWKKIGTAQHLTYVGQQVANSP